jgi:putative tryptophan/tyrosine transport system substrate-binding protein
MPKRIPRIGVLSPVTEEGMRDWWNSLRHGLANLGYVEGENIEFVWRFGDGRSERLPQLARELVEHGVDIIMPATPPAIRAAKEAANTIPVVFPLGSDPVETGLVTSIERPGGNITGMATMSRLQSQPRLALCWILRSPGRSSTHSMLQVSKQQTRSCHYLIQWRSKTLAK